MKDVSRLSVAPTVCVDLVWHPTEGQSLRVWSWPHHMMAAPSAPCYSGHALSPAGPMDRVHRLVVRLLLVLVAVRNAEASTQQLFVVVTLAINTLSPESCVGVSSNR